PLRPDVDAHQCRARPATPDSAITSSERRSGGTSCTTAGSSFCSFRAYSGAWPSFSSASRRFGGCRSRTANCSASIRSAAPACPGTSRTALSAARLLPNEEVGGVDAAVAVEIGTIPGTEGRHLRTAVRGNGNAVVHSPYL